MQFLNLSHDDGIQEPEDPTLAKLRHQLQYVNFFKTLNSPAVPKGGIFIIFSQILIVTFKFFQIMNQDLKFLLILVALIDMSLQIEELELIWLEARWHLETREVRLIVDLKNKPIDTWHFK